MDPRDCGLRYRLYVAGRVVDEEWVDVMAGDMVQRFEKVIDRQITLAQVATDMGLPWLAEVYDPAEPGAGQYQRLGTDLAGMIEPWVVEHA